MALPPTARHFLRVPELESAATTTTVADCAELMSLAGTFDGVLERFFFVPR